MNNQSTILKNVTIHIKKGYLRRIEIELNEDITFTNSEGKEWHLKAGDRTDGNSVPFPFNALFPALDESIMAAFCHDQDCNNALDYRQRRRGDNYYLQNMKEAGVPWWARWSKYSGVTLKAVWLKLRGKV